MLDNDGAELPISGLRTCLDAADPLALLLTTVHHTGDLELLREQWRPDMAIGVVDNGYSPQTQAQIRATCVSALERTRARTTHRPDYDLLERIVA